MVDLLKLTLRVLLTASLLLALAVCSGCSGSGTKFFSLSEGDDFLAITAKLEAQGFRVESRDERPYIFTIDDFKSYYTFTSHAPQLDQLKAVFTALVTADPNYPTLESVYLDTYLLRRGVDDAEAGFSLSAFDGSLLYAYCFVGNIVPVLEHYRARLDVQGPFLSSEDQGDFSFWCAEQGSEVMIIDTGNDPANDPYGGVLVFYTDNIKAFYAHMRAELEKGD